MLEAFEAAGVRLRDYSPLTLAFLGDAVFELLVRTRLAKGGNRPAGALHQMSIRRVCAQAQAQGYAHISAMLTEEEADVFRRGRNASPSHTPKHASKSDYHHATGVEALFGYLYIKGDIQRLETLFDHMQEQYEKAGARHETKGSSSPGGE